MAASRNQVIIGILLLLTVIGGFTLRTVWNAEAAQGPDGNYLLSGNDPYYHKHAVDHITETWSTLEFDPMLNYPIGSVNPNPPLYQWSAAVGAWAMQPFTDSMEEAVWISMLGSPAIWGALTIIPAFLIGRMFAGPWAGLLAGFLVATSPEHMSRTNLGFGDHDAIVIFLATFSFYFLMRSLRAIGTDRKFGEVGGMAAGFGSWFDGNRRSSGSAILAGGFIAGLALTWKGFPYVFGVVLAYTGVQFLINHWRGKDVSRPTYALATALGVGLLASLPYYLSFGLMHFWNPALFLMLAVIVLGIYFMATQEYPSILVLPGLLLVGAVFLAVMFLVVPDIAQALLHRFVYFRQTTLYTTIAEAHPADFSSLAFTVGPIPFFLYLAGFLFLGYKLWTEPRAALMFFTVWAAVDLFMAISAVRFLSQAVPTMAILAALSTVWLVRMLKLPNLLDRYRMAGGGWRGLRRSVNVMHIVAVIIVGLLVLAPNAYLAVDAAVPANIENRNAQEARAAALEDVTAKAHELGLAQETIREFQQIVNVSRGADDFQSRLRDTQLRLGLDAGTVNAIYEAGEGEMQTVGTFAKRLGAFGTSFMPRGWFNALQDLSQRDTEQTPGERPAFLAWWDYGHWAIAVGQHPAVADNFQNGYRMAGTFLVAQNESHAVQLMAARHANIMDQQAYVDLLTDHGLEPFEAEQYYEAFSSKRYPHIQFAQDEQENLRISNAWVQDVEEDTGKRIRYVAADNRMLPIDNPQTPRIENPSIFYAPVTLAGEDPQEYVEQVVVDMSTGRVLSDAELRQIQRNPNQQANLGQQLQYHEPFFNSMYFRTFMGLPVQPPVTQGGQQFPIPFDRAAYQTFYQEPGMLRGEGPVSGNVLTNEVAPGFGLVHFRLIYANDAVRMMEYTPGAIVRGTVTLEDAAQEGLRVTVFDDAGDQVKRANPGYFADRNASDLDVPHDSVLTDGNGSFELVAPFSTDRGVRVVVTQERQQGAPTVLAEQTLQISREEAAQREVFELDLAIEPATLTGVVFHDVNGNGTLEDGEEPLGNVTVSVQGETATTDADGTYTIEGLTPGRHPVTLEADAYRLLPGSATVTLRGGETVDKDLAAELEPVTVTGEVVDDNGEAVEGVNLHFTPTEASDTGRETTKFSQLNGTLEVTLQPGTYDVAGNTTDPDTNRTLEVVAVEVVGGTGATVNDDGALVIEPGAADVEVRIRLAPAA